MTKQNTSVHTDANALQVFIGMGKNNDETDHKIIPRIYIDSSIHFCGKGQQRLFITYLQRFVRRISNQIFDSVQILSKMNNRDHLGVS